MSGPVDPQLAVELSRLAVQRGAARAEDVSEPTSEQLLASVRAFHDLARASAELQGQAVRAAHDAGVSWSRIGALLGTSRQAVQQRFDPSYSSRGQDDEATRILGPVSRAEELRHLAEAGQQGWRLVSSFHGEHVLEHDGLDWEIRRVSVFSPRALPAEKDGWRAVTTRFPDCFYVRRPRSSRQSS